MQTENNYKRGKNQIGYCSFYEVLIIVEKFYRGAFYTLFITFSFDLLST